MPDYQETSIESIEHRGVLVGECSLEGERTSDQAVPAHPNCIQLSRNRWLVMYSTRKFRGIDDERSIVYQIRADEPDGPVLKEDFFAQSIDDWDPSGAGQESWVKQHGHPVAFGVPKGALINGKPAVNANLFAVKWRIVGRQFDPTTNVLEGTDPDPTLVGRTQGIQWTQIRLNEAEDDIEVVQPVKQLRQKGYEQGEVVCSAEDFQFMFQNYTCAIPYTDDCLQWVDCCSFDGFRMAAVKYVFNSESGVYEWMETGPMLFDGSKTFSDASLARYQDYWVAAARTDHVINHEKFGQGLGWVRLEDPFKAPEEIIYPDEPPAQVPIHVSWCPDGVLRVFSGDVKASPYGTQRNPLYGWDIDSDDGFRASNRRVMFDSVKAGLPIREKAVPMIDMFKLVPNVGRTQFFMHRVNLMSNLHPHVHTKPVHWVFPIVNQEEIETCGVYYGVIKYRDELPSAWDFS